MFMQSHPDLQAAVTTVHANMLSVIEGTALRRRTAVCLPVDLADEALIV
jgi:hypothetical protein